MTRRLWTIIEGDPWRFSRCGDGAETIPVDTPPDSGPEALAADISAAMRDAGYDAEDVLLQISSDSCLSAAIDLSRLPRRPSREMLTYELESGLPVAAEEIVADFITPTGVAAEALGIAVQTEKHRPLLDALEAEGIAVSSIVPRALLAFQSLRADQLPEEPGFVVWQGGDRLEVFQIRNRCPVRWSVLPATVEALLPLLRIAAMNCESGIDVHLFGCDDDLIRSLNECVQAPETPELRMSVFRAPDFDEAAGASAAAVLKGAAPLVELRRDALANPRARQAARAMMRTATAAVALLLLALTAALWWRGQRYDVLADDYYRQQTEVFRQILPDERVPVGIRSRLESEAAKARGTSGAAAELPTLDSAIEALAAALAALPEDCRLNLREIEVTGRYVSLDGAVPELGDVSRIVSLMQSAGFDAPTPPTQQSPDQGVTFQLGALCPEQSRTASN